MKKVKIDKVFFVAIALFAVTAVFIYGLSDTKTSGPEQPPIEEEIHLKASRGGAPFGQYGFEDKAGNMVIERKYDVAQDFSEGLAAVATCESENPRKCRWKYIDKKEEKAFEMEFDYAMPFSEGLAAVGVGECSEYGFVDTEDNRCKWGYVDKKGEMVIAPQFDCADGFREGLAGVGFGSCWPNGMDNSKWGFIDRTGEIVVEPEYNGLWGAFYNGKAIVGVSGGTSCDSVLSATPFGPCHWGMIGANGERIIEPKHRSFYLLNNGVFIGDWHDNDSGRRVGSVYDGDGNEIARYDSVMPFTNDLILFEDNEKYGISDAEGKIYVKPIFEAVKRNSYYMGKNYEVIPGAAQIGDAASGSGLTAVKVHGKWGFVDEAAKFAIEPAYVLAACSQEECFSEGLAAVKLCAGKSCKWGYINASGEMVIAPQFSGFCNFKEGFACIIGENGLYGFINKKGENITDEKFTDARDFSEGLAAVKVNDKWGFIDASGEIVISADFELNYSGFRREGFKEGLAPVKKDDKYGYIDKTGKFAIPPRYDRAYDFVNGYARVEVDSKWGWIDKNGDLSLNDSRENKHISILYSPRREQFLDMETVIER